MNISVLKDVRIYANVVTHKPAFINGKVMGQRPVNTRKWVNLKKGDIREDISMIAGIDPRFVPENKAQLFETGVELVPVKYDLKQSEPQLIFDFLEIEKT